MFTTVGSDTLLEPIGRFREEVTATEYPPIKAGHQVANELAKVGLATSEQEGGPQGGSKL
jgi:hypothetical protein